MRDAGVGQHAFDVALRQGQQVAQRHRQRRQHGDQEDPVDARRIQGHHQHADQRGKTRRLGPYRQERRHRRGGAFVDVGGPLVEGNHRDLESEAGQHQGHGEVERRDRSRAQPLGDLVQVRRAGQTVHQREPIEHHRRRRGAEQEVLDAGLVALRVALQEAGQHVRGEADILDGQCQQDEIGAGRHQH